MLTALTSPRSRPRRPHGARPWFEQGLGDLVRSPRGRLALAAVAGVLVLVLSIGAARRFADTPWPLSRGHPGLLAAAGLLLFVAYALKIWAWRRLFAADERPHTSALAAATGGASLAGLALPGRCADVVRITIVRRSKDCPAGVKALCLSLVVLGFIEIAALAPLVLALALLPGHAGALRVGLAVLAGVGFAAGGLVAVLPRVATSGRVARSRLGRWLRPRATSFRVSSAACAVVSVSWIVRAMALVLLLGALGAGFSFALAVLYLSAGAAAGIVPIGPAGAAKAGAGAAALMASGVGPAQALDVALAGQTLGVLCGAAILVCVAAWRVRNALLGGRAVAGAATG